MNLGHSWGTSGPPVVLIHGIGGVSGLWEPIAKRLAEQYLVYAPDLPGHGTSAAEVGELSLAAFTTELGKFLDAMNLAEPVLIGHSFGGCIALHFAAQSSVSVRAVAAIEAVIYPKARPMGPRPDLVERARKRTANWSDRAEMRSFLAARPVHSRWRSDLLDIYIRDCTVDREDGRVEAHFGAELESRFIETTYAETVYTSPWDHFAKIRCPTLVARATYSQFLTPETLREVADTVPRIETVEIENAGHFVVLERPDAVSELLCDWLGRTCPV